MQRNRSNLIAVLIAAASLLLGLGTWCLGSVLDPFSIPFQDYESIPREQQITYEQRAMRMQSLRVLGGRIAIASAVALPVLLVLTWVRRPTQPSEDSSG